MPYQLTFEETKGLTLVTVKGTITYSDEYLDKASAIVEHGLASKRRTFLVDERGLDFVRALDTMEAAHIAEKFIADGIQTKGGRLACLYNPEYLSLYRTIETIYQNRSLAYRIFTDETDAIRWLNR